LPEGAIASAKEVDRRWEEGDVLEAARQRPIEYERASSRAGESLVEPGLYLSRLVTEIGIRKLNRQGFGRRILEKISRRQPVKASNCGITSVESSNTRVQPGKGKIACGAIKYRVAV